MSVSVKVIVGVVIAILIASVGLPIAFNGARSAEDVPYSKTYVKTTGANTPEAIQLRQTPIATASVRVLYDLTPIPTNTPVVNYATGVVTVDDGAAETSIRIDYVYKNQGTTWTLFGLVFVGALLALVVLFMRFRNNK